jgi:hypothetical protein
MTRDPNWPPRFGTDHATPVAYEQAALEAVRETLREPPLRDSVVVQDVILVGHYPRAQIVVRLLRDRRPQTATWELYEDVFSGTRGQDDPFEPAEGVAQGMWVDIAEGVGD